MDKEVRLTTTPADIYRGIEHVITYYKARRAGLNASARNLSTALIVDYDPRAKILLPLELAFQNLPARFKQALPMSQDVRQNRCGFQAANVIATFQVCYTPFPQVLC